MTWMCEDNGAWHRKILELLELFILNGKENQKIFAKFSQWRGLYPEKAFFGI